MLQFLRLSFLNGLQDVGLLLLRVSLGFSMLLLHGWDKFQHFEKKAVGFPQVFGMPSSLNLSLAVFAEVACSVLLILGLFTRFAALNLAATMAVAFFIVHKGAFTGPQSGELAFVYLMGSAALIFTGGGKFSADGGR